jgi:hypothetical protein
MALVRFINKPQNMILFHNLFQNNNPNQIGRWRVPETPKYIEKTNLILDRSNEDHCGGCGNNLLLNNIDINYDIIYNKTNIFIDNLFSDNEKYYFPFTI